MMTPKCSLCGSSSVRVVDSLTKEQVIALWRDLNFDLSATALDCCGKVDTIDFFKCDQCGFEFADPSTVGDSNFYGALFSQASNSYYSPVRPENEWALELMKRGKGRRVLDVGCGSGAFLEFAHKAGMEVSGMEHSASAAEAARAKGFTILEKPLSISMPEDFGGAFDWVTLFQVLEHVPDPVDFIRSSARLLKPGGGLFIAVPSEGQVLDRLAPYDPHRWPPHHVSRWTNKAFTLLAEKVGLDVKEITQSTLEKGMVRYFAGLGQRQKKILHPDSPAGPSWYPGAMALLYAALTLNYQLGQRWGHAMFVHLQKPASP
jgi:2-polyprenyl-3-methyl-5-hydroxy-6-metoxy-1,4-benzoquinol methylase